eukprot:EG_transcript_9095
MAASGGGWRWLSVLGPLALAVAYVFCAPWTKVEESFNMQATHDLLYYGHHIEQYDHHLFPGPVPRTFIGALSLSLAAKPFVAAADLLFPRCDRVAALYVVRLVLAVSTFLCFDRFRFAVRHRFGAPAAHCLTLVTCSQFHLLFYSSRTLPNTFALCCVYLALAQWLNGWPKTSLVTFTLAIVVFRFDVAVLLVPCLGAMLPRREVAFHEAVLVGVAATAGFAASTVLIDSFFWRRWLWPEAEVLFFNTVLNKSSEWGTSPGHWYFTSALPRALLAAYPLYAAAFVAEPRFRVYSAAGLSMVALYSLLPHKELRFIFYALPLLNAHVAIALARWYHTRGKSRLRFLWWAGCVVGLLASAAACGAFLWASSNNYPAGEALRVLHADSGNQTSGEFIHLDVYSTMNGITRFQKQYCGSRRYSKDPTFIGAEAAACPPFTCPRNGRLWLGWSQTWRAGSGDGV